MKIGFLEIHLYTKKIYNDINNSASLFNCFPFPTTGLTPKNVLNELKELTWWTLCNTGSSTAYGIEPFHGICAGILELPMSEAQKIERMYVSVEERKSAGVLWWVDHHPLASWRLLITQLDEKGKHSLANRIHQYAEKVTGMLSSVLYCH